MHFQLRISHDPSYHSSPIAERTWFIHYDTKYEDSSVTGFGDPNSSFFDQVDSILIPPKDGKSTADQIKEVNGNLSMINPAYTDPESMTAALNKLAADNATYQTLPITWIRMMHPKGSGYAVISDAVIDEVLNFKTDGVNASSSTSTSSTISSTPTPSQAPQPQRACGFGTNKFISRDEMNKQIGVFCADAAKQGVQDKNSGAILRDYNTGTRDEVFLSIDWPPGMDISKDMEATCKLYMTQIMDGKFFACYYYLRVVISPITNAITRLRRERSQ
jgi:hypothetical protein